MTRLGYRTQARRVFRQGNGINPHFQHTPQYFSPICRCSGMCKTSLLDVDTVRGTDELGWESRRQLSLGRYLLAQPGHQNPASTQTATTDINPNATMNAMRIQASPTPCSGCGKERAVTFAGAT